MEAAHGTTIVLVRRGSKVAMAGDGQITHGQTVLKSTARKIRRLHHDQILAGFAGSTADALSLFSRFETKLEEFEGNLQRASLELAKEWRTDKFLRQLEAMLIVGDRSNSFLISGEGDVFEADDGVVAIGSGGGYALAAARALLGFSKKTPREIAEESLKIASDICIFTNSNILVEQL